MSAIAKRLSRLENLKPKKGHPAKIILRSIVGADDGKPISSVLRSGFVVGMSGRHERQAGETKHEFFERLQAIRYAGSSSTTQIELRNAIEHLRQKGQLEKFEDTDL